jgi:hypothetical protein
MDMHGAFKGDILMMQSMKLFQIVYGQLSNGTNLCLSMISGNIQTVQ